MLINGQKPQGINIVPIVLPRANQPNIVLKAQAVLDMDEFEKLYPRPEPPMKLKPGGIKVPDTENEEYKKKLEDRAYANTDFMVLKSLEATPNLSWETVNMSDYTTWKNWRKEAKESGIIDVEISRILMGVMEANSLNERVIDEARQRFLVNQALEGAAK